VRRWLSDLPLRVRIRVLVWATVALGGLAFATVYTVMQAAAAGQPVWIAACAAVAALAAVALLAGLRASVLKPLEALLSHLRATRPAAAAAASTSLGSDELQQLREELGRLLEETEASARNLRAYKTEFERRVRERTGQLERQVAEARAATKEAEGASDARSDFLARMSHEIRTPLNGVLGMAELLQHSATLDHRQRRYATVIHQSGESLLQLINEVLDFSKIEAGKLELDQERFCVREMVEDALEIMAERAQSKGLELGCEVPFDLDTVVFADCLRLRQVILNLVGNALKFTERGDVTVTVRAETGIESSRFTFEVADTGIGISAEDCATIFEAFVQAKQTAPQHHHGGTGLGLAISKQLVELMGGTIGVQSTVGKGSRFFFTVPLAVDRTAARERPGTALAQTRFLIVDKSEAARRVLRHHLKSWGAISTELASADEALARLRSALSGEFDVLVIDAHLPGTTVTDTVAAVRHIAAFADTPILLTHTGTEPPPESRLLEGPVGWQSKPIRRSQLRETLARLTGNPRLAEAAAPYSGGLRPESSGAAPAQRGLQVRRVLLVEDNTVNQEVAREMLENLAIEVHTADSGEAALAQLAAERFDAVLMDCEMPVLDGYATTERYRQWERQHGQRRTPVVALTANALQGDDGKCFSAGMDHYLSKPFSNEQLRAVLELCAVPGADAEAPQPQPAAGALDAKALGHVRRLGAARGSDLMPRLMALYTSSSKELLKKLYSAERNGDLEGMRQASHALKSSSTNVGAGSLAETCAALERAARSGKARLASFLVERIVREHQEVLRAVGETLGESIAGGAGEPTARGSSTLAPQGPVSVDS